MTKGPARAKPFKAKKKDIKGSYNVFYTILNWQSGRSSDHRKFVESATSDRDAIKQATSKLDKGFTLVIAVAVLIAAAEVSGGSTTTLGIAAILLALRIITKIL